MQIYFFFPLILDLLHFFKTLEGPEFGPLLARFPDGTWVLPVQLRCSVVSKMWSWNTRLVYGWSSELSDCNRTTKFEDLSWHPRGHDSKSKPYRVVIHTHVRKIQSSGVQSLLWRDAMICIPPNVETGKARKRHMHQRSTRARQLSRSDRVRVCTCFRDFTQTCECFLASSTIVLI